MDDRLDLYHGGTYSTLELSYIPVSIQLITQTNSSSVCFFVWNIWFQSSTLYLERRPMPLCRRLLGSISWTCHQGPCIAGSPSKQRVHWRLDPHGPSVRGHFTSILSPRMYKTIGRWKSSAEIFSYPAVSAAKLPRYVFHLLRVGEAITLSLAGEVDKENRRVPFQEERRWLYQQQNFRLHYFLVDFFITIFVVIIYYHVQLFFKFFIPLFPVLARVSSLKSCAEESSLIFPSCSFLGEAPRYCGHLWTGCCL